MRKIYLLSLLVVLFTATSFAGSRTHFLSHGPSVRAFGRGETAASKLDDSSAMYYNPSLISNIRQANLNLSYYSLFEGSMYSFFGFCMPIKNNSFGISAINLKSGDVEIRQNIDDVAEKTNTNHWAGYLTFARHFAELYELNIGLNLKYIVEDLHDYKGNGIGLDLGMEKELKGPVISGNQSTINIGLTGQNILQPKIKLISEEETFSQIYRFGLSLNLPVYSRAFSYDNLGIYTDFALEEDNFKYFTGLEYAFFNKYILRAGYYKDHTTLGAGYNHGIFSIDYAADLIDYTNFHRFGFSLFFGKKSEKDRSFKKKDKQVIKPKDDALMREAQAALAKDRKTKAKQQKEIKPLFNDAKKDYKKKRYLKAVDKFGELVLKYPDYKVARDYYNKIFNLMDITSKDTDTTDLEKLSYAKGFINYHNQQFYESINEWEKVVQLNPKRKELEEYSSKVKAYLKDIERREKEKEIEERVKNIYEKGVSEFNGKKWVRCIKKMENVQNICRKEPFQNSVQWHQKAQAYIEKSVKQLAKMVSKKPEEKIAEKEPDIEIDEEGAQKKYNDGLILYAQGKLSDAMKMWDIAIRLNPNHEKAHIALQKCREELELLKKK